MPKKLHKTSAVNILARVLGMFSGMLGVYVFSRLFTVDDFGVWSWLLSISVIVTSQDFGILSAMRVWLGKEYAQNNLAKQQTIFIAGITGISSILLILLFGEGFYWLMHSKPLTTDTVMVCWVLFTATFSILGTVCANALLAFLNSSVVGLIELARSIMQILLIFTIYFFKLDLLTSVAVYYLLFILYVPVVFGVLTSLHNWELKKLWFLGKERWFEVLQAITSLIKNGVLLWINQLAFALILSADIFYAGVLLSKEDLSTITIINKLVGLGVGIFSAGLLPYFGLYVHRLAKQDTSWIPKELNKALPIIGIVGIAYTAGLLMLGKSFVFTWTGYTIDSQLLYFLAGAQLIVLCLMVYVQLFFQGPRINFQILPFVLVASAIRLACLWGSYQSIGLYAIFISSIVANLLLIILMLYRLRKYTKNNQKMELMW